MLAKLLSKLSYIFSNREKYNLLYILLLIIIGSAMELLGVTLFMPFIEIIMDPDVIQSNQLLSRIYDSFHLRTPLGFLRQL